MKGTYFLPRKMHLNIGVHQVSVLSYEGLLHVSHDAGVHFGKSLSAVDLYVKLGPLPLCWDALREQKVPANIHTKAMFTLQVFITSHHVY